MFLRARKPRWAPTSSFLLASRWWLLYLRAASSWTWVSLLCPSCCAPVPSHHFAFWRALPPYCFTWTWPVPNPSPTSESACRQESGPSCPASPQYRPSSEHSSPGAAHSGWCENEWRHLMTLGLIWSHHFYFIRVEIKCTYHKIYPDPTILCWNSLFTREILSFLQIWFSWFQGHCIWKVKKDF